MKSYKNKEEDIAALSQELIEHKSTIKELKKITDRIVLEKKKGFKFSFFRIFSEIKNNYIAYFLVGGFSGFILYSIFNILLTLFNGSTDIIWGVSSIVLSIILFSFFGNSLLRDVYKKQIEKITEQEIIKITELSSNELIECNVFINDEERTKISISNTKNDGVYLSDIIKIIDKREKWISENEDNINKKVKIAYNNKILENV